MKIVVLTCFLLPYFVTCLVCPHYRHIRNYARSKPLQTAGPYQISLIPRLEPGLRLLDPQLQPIWASMDNFPLLSLLQVALGEEEVATKDSRHIGDRIPLDKLFRVARKSMQEVSASLRRFCRKVVAVSLLLASVLPANAKRVSIAVASSVTAVLSVPKLVVAARSYASLPAIQRLGTTPLYFVTNSRGNAFLQEDSQSGRPGQKEVVYYMSHEDAHAMLEEMAQQHGPQAGELRLSVTSMEKVLLQMGAKKQSRKLGRFDVDTVLRIQPCFKQLQHAQQQLARQRKGRSESSPPTLPMFAARGLVVQRGAEAVVPYYFNLEDLLQDWGAARERALQAVGEASKSTPVSAAQPEVIVRDFSEVMCLADGNGLAGVVPPRQELRLLREHYRHAHPFPADSSRAKLRLS